MFPVLLLGCALARNPREARPAPHEDAGSKNAVDGGQLDRMDGGKSTERTEIWGEHPDSNHKGLCEDTYLNVGDSINYQLEQLNLYTWPAQMIANAILYRCDLSALAADTLVLEASIRLHQISSQGDETYTTTVHRLINLNPTFSETNGYQASSTEPWTENLCCQNEVPLAQADIGPELDSQALDLEEGRKSWNVTALVQDWIADPALNYGLMVNSDPLANTNSARYFASNEAVEPTTRPQLVIRFRPGVQ